MPTTVAPECLAEEKLRVETEISTCRYFYLSGLRCPGLEKKLWVIDVAEGAEQQA